MAKSGKHRRKVVFLLVGVFNTALDFSFYTFLTSTAFKNGHNIATAGFISGTFALFSAFVTHSFITWRGANITKHTFMKFFLFTGFGMWVIRPLLLAVFIHLTSVYSSVQRLVGNIGLNFSYNFIANSGAFGLMLLIVLIYNFLTYDRYVFSPDESHTAPENH